MTFMMDLPETDAQPARFCKNVTIKRGFCRAEGGGAGGIRSSQAECYNGNRRDGNQFMADIESGWSLCVATLRPVIFRTRPRPRAAALQLAPLSQQVVIERRQ